MNATHPQDCRQPLIMSTEQQPLLTFESYLKKRKDKMKLRWVRYWFRLQNTSLFFYTRKHGSAVQSVREVWRGGSDLFAFEITMKNGKTKLLAAETEELRRAWVCLLWKAMQLLQSGRADSASVWGDVAELKQRAQDSLLSSSYSDDGVDLDSEPHCSSPAHRLRTPPCQEPLPSEPATICGQEAQPTTVCVSAQNSFAFENLSQKSEKDTPRSKGDGPNEMAIYDIPPSSKKACKDLSAGCEAMSDDIYDVPTPLASRCVGTNPVNPSCESKITRECDSPAETEVNF